MAMKKTWVIAAMALMVGVLAGCEEEPKSIQWWRDHPVDLEKKIKSCLSSKEASESPDCKNAGKAAFRNVR